MLHSKVPVAAHSNCQNIYQFEENKETVNFLVECVRVVDKGQVISEGFLVSSISFKKRTKTRRIVVFWKNSWLDNLLPKLTGLYLDTLKQK